MKFIGKGPALLKLKGIKNIKIPELILISFKEYLKNKNKIILSIKRKFKEKVAIRSSSVSEDRLKKSNAGKFESVINVNAQNKSVIETAKLSTLKVRKMILKRTILSSK